MAALAVLIWLAATVPLGERTLLQHLRHIGHAESADEARQRAGELVEGAKDKTAPALDKLTPELPDGEDRHWMDRSVNRYRK